MPDSPSDNVRRREKAIRLTVAASAAAKAFSVVCTFVQVPIALHYLGTEAYGFWITLFSIVIVLNSVDFGLGVGMQHAMARAFGADDHESMRRTFWTGAAVLCLLGAAVLAIGLSLAFLLPWADILKIRDSALRADVGRALLLSVALFVAGLPFNAVVRLGAAVQRGWIQAGWIAAGSGISLVMVAVAAWGRFGFLWFLAATLCVPVIQGLGLAVHLLWRLGWDMRPSRLAPAHEVRHMLSSSLTYAFPQLGMVLVQSLPPIAISAAAGSAAVTAYNLLVRLYSPFQQGQILLLAPIWPAYTEAHARDDHGWVTRTFWKTMAASAGLVAGLVLVAWFSERLLALWVGSGPALDSARFAMPVAVWCILQMAAQPAIHCLIGVGRLRQLAWAATPGLLLTCAALLFGARWDTLGGVLAAGSVVLAVCALPPLVWESVRAVRTGERRLAVA